MSIILTSLLFLFRTIYLCYCEYFIYFQAKKAVVIIIVSISILVLKYSILVIVKATALPFKDLI